MPTPGMRREALLSSQSGISSWLIAPPRRSTCARAGRELDELRNIVAQATHETLCLFDDLARAVLNRRISEATLHTTIAQRIAPERLDVQSRSATR